MDRAGEALEAVARACGLPTRPPTGGVRSSATQSAERFAQWLDTAAASLGLEVEETQSELAEIDAFVRGAGPALLRIGGGATAGMLAVIGGSRRTVSVLTPGHAVRRVAISSVRALLAEAAIAPIAKEIDILLDEAGVPDRRRSRVRERILRERLGGMAAASGWIVRLPPGADVAAQASRAGLWKQLAALIAAHAAAYVLWIVSWWIVGRGALDGRLDRGWLTAWALLLATIVPFELLVTWLQGRLSIEAGALLKRRLLHGALRLDPEEIRHEGAGHLLGRVIESQAIEALALSGGFLALVSAIELLFAVAVLATARWWLAVLLLACVAVHAIVGRQFSSARGRWSRGRLNLTHDLVERIVGHRTRAAQELAGDRHAYEDEALTRYVDESRSMDRAAVLASALMPRLWLLGGTGGVGILFFNGESTATLAVALAGVLMAYRALRVLASGVVDLAGAAIAWRQAAPIFHAAARVRPVGSLALGASASPMADKGAPAGLPLINARDLVFRHRERGNPVLRGCSLSIYPGDRLLLQGPSGSGKSTLASLLIGLRAPESGLLLLDGADRHSLGADLWRRRSVGVPQFHENHVLVGSLLFNVMMGARWPPAAADVRRAATICSELGLEPLLARMPAGLQQEVGETGWQLSHGERSRLFIARALVQDADLLVLDESFAQLDPENVERTLGCVLNHANTLMVIAHP
jgi:ATP-binding cassette subfamily B protein